MFVILFVVRRRDRLAEHQGVEMHVSPYIRRGALLSPAEQRFYARLYQAVGTDVLICPKVRLADAVEVRGDAMEWQAAWNRIAAKHVDFLLITADEYRPLLAIQLDDGAREAQQRAEWLDRALVAAGLPILRLRVRSDYDPVALRREVELRVSPGG
jgi:hypothetical protein